MKKSICSQQFGFVEQHPERRRIGGQRGHILLLTEKQETAKFATRLATEFDLSLLLLSGQPPLSAVEFFAAALREAGILRITLVALVDYDPWGWGKQLQSLGIEVEGVEFLIRGSVLSDEEKRLFAYPYPAGLKAGNAEWLAEAGGVDGKALGVHANHIQPFERVRELLVEWLESGGALSDC